VDGRKEFQLKIDGLGFSVLPRDGDDWVEAKTWEIGLHICVFHCKFIIKILTVIYNHERT